MAALLRLHAGKGAGGIDEGHHRQPEALRQPHQADRLAIALGLGHAEIVADARRGIVALFVPDHHHAAAVDEAEPADDRLIVGEGAIARERHEIRDEAGEIILEVRPLGVARHLRLLPRRELGIGLAQQPVRLGLEARDLAADVERPRIGGGGVAQFGDPRLELGDGLLEFEEGGHGGAR